MVAKYEYRIENLGYVFSPSRMNYVQLQDVVVAIVAVGVVERN